MTTIVAVGDLMLGDSAISPGFGFASRYPDAEIGSVFHHVSSHLQGADVAFGNLETTLSRADLNARDLGSVQMRGYPNYARALRAAGFNCLGVANNHAVQHGLHSFTHTVELLRREGVQVCGLKGKDGWTCDPVVMPLKNAGSLGILGYCLRPRQYRSEEPPFAEGGLEDILADLARLKRDVQYVMISLHWGEEFVEIPSIDEVTLARSIIDAGGNIIAGHHPHVLRPVERYRRGVIAYSLGNFAADMIWQDNLRTGGLLRCRLDSHGLASAFLVRVQIDRDFRPRPGTTSEIAENAPVRGLEPSVHGSVLRRSLRSQRARAYMYAIGNLWRYPAGLLLQLLMNTLRNKVRAAAKLFRKDAIA
jgi:gamma-polyglutamate biosynthesis protein CapA